MSMVLPSVFCILQFGMWYELDLLKTVAAAVAAATTKDAVQHELFPNSMLSFQEEIVPIKTEVILNFVWIENGQHVHMHESCSCLFTFVLQWVHSLFDFDLYGNEI